MVSDSLVIVVLPRRVFRFFPKIWDFFRGAHATFLRLAELQPHEGEEIRWILRWGVAGLGPTVTCGGLVESLRGPPNTAIWDWQGGVGGVYFFGSGGWFGEVSYQLMFRRSLGGLMNNYKLQLHHNILHKYCIYWNSSWSAIDPCVCLGLKHLGEDGGQEYLQENCPEWKERADKVGPSGTANRPTRWGGPSWTIMNFSHFFFLYSVSSKNYLRNGGRLTPKNVLLSVHLVHLEILECVWCSKSSSNI